MTTPRRTRRKSKAAPKQPQLLNGDAGLATAPALTTPPSWQKAEALYRAGDVPAAAAILAPLAEDGAADATTLRLLGLCRLRQGDGAAALALMERARARAPHDPLVQLHLGLVLQALGRPAQAAALFEATCQTLPDDPAPPLNLATALLALERPSAAVQAASAACARAPGMAEAHYTYGLCWLALGEFDRAEQAFTAAAGLKPGLADAWLNLGVARYRKGDAEGAKAMMRRALTAQPGHRAATANLAAFMRLTGEGEAAERLLREHVAGDPGSVEARLNLAAELLSEERCGEVLALLDSPPPSDPRQRRHWRLQQSLALIQARRHVDARAALDDAGPLPPDLAPLGLWRRVLLAMEAKDNRTACRTALEMEAALEAAGEAVIPEHAIMARYDLAKFWSMQNAPGRAFPQWVEGHALLKRFQPFSRDAYRGFVDASIARLDRTRLQDGPRASNSDPATVFIVGTPRSGTTLAEQILAAHGQAYGAGERSALGQAFTVLGGHWESAQAVERIAGLGASTLDQAAGQYLGSLHALAPDASRIVDKMPGNFRYLGLVGLMLPGARIIHCVRDPRDVGLSIFTFRFHGHHSYAHDLADLGWYIGEHDRLMRHWREALPNPILTLRLSDWVQDFDDTLARVLAFVGLPSDPACERFYEQGSRVRTVSRTQVRQPVNAKGIGRWKAYADQLGPLLDELEKAGSLDAWR